jgi:hypothetical protein
MSGGGVILDKDLMSNLMPVKKFKETKQSGFSTSIDFDYSGQYCIVSCPKDEILNLYDCIDGE